MSSPRRDKTKTKRSVTYPYNVLGYSVSARLPLEHKWTSGDIKLQSYQVAALSSSGAIK